MTGVASDISAYLRRLAMGFFSSYHADPPVRLCLALSALRVLTTVNKETLLGKGASIGKDKAVKGLALPLGKMSCWTGVPGTKENGSMTMVKNRSGL